MCENQPQLLKGIDDNVEILSEVFNEENAPVEYLCEGEREIWSEENTNHPQNNIGELSQNEPTSNHKSKNQPQLSNKNTEDNQGDDENIPELNEERGYPLDTCLQPVELKGNEIFSIAPAEGNRPLSLFTDQNAEVLSFPTLFPKGQFGFNTNRHTKLHFRKYLNARLLNIDTRFANNIDYIFFMQFWAEKKQILDNVHVVLRKSQNCESVTAGLLRSSETLKTFIAKDMAYTIFKNIRGSPAYWQRTLYDLLGMVRQLGTFTWFLTLSSADLRWTDTIRIIAQQYGVTLSDEDIDKLTWEQRSKWIRNNPVTAARHFDYKVQQFFKIIIQKNKVLGNVSDFFIRTEFQQRGSPHVHCVLWVKDAPVIGEASDEDVCSFIDNNVHCTLPSNDDQLYTLVSTLQKHSHRRTCRKKGRFCRFHFPKPPVSRTLIASPESETLEKKPSPDKIEPNYKEIVIGVQQLIQELDDNQSNTSPTIQEVLDACDVTEEEYHEALKKLQKTTKVLHKRNPKDRCINNYNPVILKSWKANMDLQFVTDVYSCIMYIVSYITKDERELSDLLRHTSKQANDQNIRQQLRTLGNVFLNHREITAQEAIYRALPIPLRRTSRTIVYVPTDFPEDRVKLMKPLYVIENLDDDSEEVFCTSIIDRYIARPAGLEDMCLAHFATWYTLKNTDKDDSHPALIEDDTNEQLSKKVIKLQDNKGYMAKRRQQAILRTHVYSKLKQTENFFHSKLMLYAPWRNENDLKGNIPSYEQSFLQQSETFNDNFQQFEHNSDLLNTALQDYEENGPITDIWDSLNSETVQTNEEDMNQQRALDPDSAFTNPEFSTGINSNDIRHEIGVSAVSYTVNDHRLSEEDTRELIQKLNTEQKEIFTEILSWCRQCSKSRKQGPKPPPLYTFITGGAGTGKSLLIKAIFNMAVKELEAEGDSPSDTTVLLLAPTGTAAFNIDGMTMHSALKLPLKQHSKQGEYQPLSQEKLHDLRCKLANLTIIIIDEISMVSSQDLYNIHRRLSEIMGTTQSDEYFGGLSILAVGDLYQLPPVAARPVYALPKSPLARLAGSLWENLFNIHHLVTIMRQKDDEDFANMLNRIRLETHTDEDVAVLQTRLSTPTDLNYPHDALHIFATNREVNEHNAAKLSTLSTPLHTMVAKDTKPDNSPLPDSFNLPDNPALTGGLSKELKLCIGARIMISKNIDVTDGLVNGTQGTVVGFLPPVSSQNIVAVIVRCDHHKSGQQTRLKYAQIARKYPESVPIFRDQVTVFIGKYARGNEILRQQFPLRLCWGCTIHKTQGMTLQQAVVSINGRFNHGQCYVALSRVTSINGLYLTKFDKNKIRASQETHDAMKLMNTRPVSVSINRVIERPSQLIKIALLNTRSIIKHEKDIRSCNNLLMTDILCFTETWLKRQETPMLQSMSAFRQDRLHKQAGGVLIYVNNEYQAKFVNSKTTKSIDILSLEVTAYGEIFNILLVYCAPNANLTEATQIVQEFSLSVPNEIPIMILGDFNKLKLQDKIRSRNLCALVNVPTCKSGSTLDQVYTDWKPSPTVHISPAYFSDHDIIWIGMRRT